uniref:Ig-like domain-containing protein n=1 Tax=Timema douglasi TaxID=61478 RepID=A0A7R8VJY8_TIMDO|nr:unnamed protein product [Timema douglasi]
MGIDNIYQKRQLQITRLDLTYEQMEISLNNHVKHACRGARSLTITPCVLVYQPVGRDARKKPTFCTRLTDRTAAQGSRLKLTASVLGTPEPSVEWLRDGLPLFLNPDDPTMRRFRSTCRDGLANLEVVDASPSDSGEYTCVARNIHGEVTSTAVLKVFAGFEPAPFPPTFTRAIKDTYRFGEDELVLECRVRSHPSPKVTWLKDGLPVRVGSRYQMTELRDGVCRLTVSSPESGDSGRYTCKAENLLWSDQISESITFLGRDQYGSSRRSARSTVGQCLSRDSRRPQFSSVLTDHLVPSGGTIALQVEVKGAPKPEITWLRGSEPLLSRTSHRVRTFEESGVHTLMVAGVTESEAGLYTCRASNLFGHVDTSAAVEVVPPGSVRGGKPAMFMSRPDQDMAVALGEDITVSFRVAGDPKPQGSMHWQYRVLVAVTWLKGIRDITNSQRSLKETFDDYVRLTLKRALPSDVGTYCILAKNVYGCDRSFVTVRIRQRARSLTPSGGWSNLETSTILRDIRDQLERDRLKVGMRNKGSAPKFAWKGTNQTSTTPPPLNCTLSVNGDQMQCGLNTLSCAFPGSMSTTVIEASSVSIKYTWDMNPHWCKHTVKKPPRPSPGLALGGVGRSQDSPAPCDVTFDCEALREISSLETRIKHPPAAVVLQELSNSRPLQDILLVLKTLALSQPRWGQEPNFNNSPPTTSVPVSKQANPLAACKGIFSTSSFGNIRVTLKRRGPQFDASLRPR